MANTSSTIPKLLFLTYKVELSDRTWRKFEQAARGAYRIEFYNDSRADAFVARHCDARFVTRFGQLRGAHRSDLLRYLLLYHFGGVYLDVYAVGTRTSLGCRIHIL